MKLISDMWLVVHVPKTAGTSFRQALEKYFGTAQVVRDYGPNAEATTEVVRNHLYDNTKTKRLGELVHAISNGAAKILVGHFPLRKYVNFFEPENIITFVRDPLERACSEYLHRVKNTSFDGTFSDFMSEPGTINIQSRFLEGIPDKSFIGLTERYRESLGYINESFQLRLSVLKKMSTREVEGKNLLVIYPKMN